MASQKSTTTMAAGVEPKRQRGRDRVAAIMDAGVAVFAEKGYEAATMSEIAVRADTAIGSLYRFFPTKEVLADALLNRYGNLLLGVLDEISAKADQLSPPALADALIDAMRGLQPDRAAAIALIDARSDAAARRSTLRSALRERIATVLMRSVGSLSPERAQTTAVLLLHVLKSFRTLFQEQGGSDGTLDVEARAMIRQYLSSLRDAPDRAGEHARHHRPLPRGRTGGP